MEKKNFEPEKKNKKLIKQETNFGKKKNHQPEKKNNYPIMQETYVYYDISYLT